MIDLNTLWTGFVQQMGLAMRILMAGTTLFVGGWAAVNALPTRRH